MVDNEATRAETESAVSVTSSESEADDAGDELLVADASTTGDTESKISTDETGKKKKRNKKKKKKKKKKAKKSDSSPVDAKSQGPDQNGMEKADEMWHGFWEQLHGYLKMAKEKDKLRSQALFNKMLNRTIGAAVPGSSMNVLPGPTCANPKCRAFGHTIAICPIPTDYAEGYMTGCFFCNVYDHDADDCTMMKWASPATLVTYLITNRAGLPPWNTRINWVTLAIDQWDLVCFTKLPLTRAFVKEVYIPRRLWAEVNGVSSITDPLFKNASPELLDAFSKRTGHDQLMESSLTQCYRRSGCVDGLSHTIFTNDLVSKYIPGEAMIDAKYMAGEGADRERALAAARQEFAKKTPKRAIKERKGWRAKKREAAAAAAAAAAVAGAEEAITAGSSKPQYLDNKGESSSSSNNGDQDAPVSEKLMELAERMNELMTNFVKGLDS